MQKFFAVIVSFFVILTANVDSASSFDEEYKEITKNKELIQALNVLKNSDAKWVLDTAKGDNLSRRPIKIMFRKIGKMNSAYKTHEAFTCVDDNNKIYIFINTIHKEAPAEALAALISHEVMHQDDKNSILEETIAWTNEAVNWIAFTKQNPSLVNEPGTLVKRLNKLTSIYKEFGVAGIEQRVMANPAYKNSLITMNNT